MTEMGHFGEFLILLIPRAVAKYVRIETLYIGINDIGYSEYVK